MDHPLSATVDYQLRENITKIERSNIRSAWSSFERLLVVGDATELIANELPPW
jgi:hypothetical protein